MMILDQPSSHPFSVSSLIQLEEIGQGISKTIVIIRECFIWKSKICSSWPFERSTELMSMIHFQVKRNILATGSGKVVIAAVLMWVCPDFEKGEKRSSCCLSVMLRMQWWKRSDGYSLGPPPCSRKQFIPLRTPAINWFWRLASGNQSRSPIRNIRNWHLTRRSFDLYLTLVMVIRIWLTFHPWSVV